MILESFKNWVALNESMDVTVVGVERTEKVDTLLDISHYLMRKVISPISAKMSPEERNHINVDTITPDGGDEFERTGIINFYVQGLSRPTIDLILKGVRYWLGEIGCTMGEPKEDTHADKMRKDLDDIHKWGDEEYSPEYPEIVPKTAEQKKQEYLKWYQEKGIPDHNAIRVIRIPVVYRDQTKEPRNSCPELNMTNDAAEYIFHDLLQIQGEHGFGPIAARDLLIKIEHLTQWQKQQAVTQPSVERGAGGATIYSQGYDEERIDRYLKQIAAICRWAIQNGYDYVQCY